MKRPDPQGPVALCGGVSDAAALHIEQLLKSNDIKVYVLQSAKASSHSVSIIPVILVRREDLKRARSIVKQDFEEAARRVPPLDPTPERVLPINWHGWLTIALLTTVVAAVLLYDIWPWIVALPIAVYFARAIESYVRLRREKRIKWP